MPRLAHRLESVIDYVAAPVLPPRRRRYWQRLRLSRARSRADEDIERTLRAIEASRSARATGPSDESAAWSSRLAGDLTPLQDSALSGLGTAWDDAYQGIARSWNLDTAAWDAARWALAEAGQLVLRRIAELSEAWVVATRRHIRSYPCRYVRIGVSELEFDDGRLDTFLLADSYVQQWEFSGSTTAQVSLPRERTVQEVRVATTGGPALTGRAILEVRQSDSGDFVNVLLRGLDRPRLV